MVLPDSFTLVTFTNATLSKGSAVTTGPLSLKCISRALVIRINTSETSIDPLITVLRSQITEHDAINLTKKNIYRFLATPTELELTTDFSLDPDVHSALDMFDNILEQYVLDFKRITPSVLPPSSFSSSSSNTFEKNQDPVFDSNLRNRLILVDEETGQVVGRFEDDTFRIQQDPSIHQAARGDELVVIDLDSDWTRRDGDALQHFSRVIPIDQETWITKSAGVVSDAISLSTDLLLTTITAASSYYINHSNPSLYQSNTGSSSPSGSSDPIEPPSTTTIQHDYSQTPPPQALVSLTSSNTRQGLSIAHAISTEAVKVSSKTVGFVDEMIQQIMGGSEPESISRPSRSVPSLPAPAYPLPSQNGTPMPPLTTSDVQPQPQMSTTKASVLTSANLISSTFDSSTRRVSQVGTEQFAKIISHKYGPEAAQSSLMLASTARNLGLVFVDMTGIGRRVLVKSIKTAFVQAL